jgi:anti-sigma B factor antagonist
MGATEQTAYRVQVSVEEVDRASIGQLEAELSGALQERNGSGADLVVDLTAVRFLDSSGIRALIDADRTAGLTGGKVSLVGATGVVRRALEVSGVWDHLAESSGV